MDTEAGWSSSRASRGCGYLRYLVTFVSSQQHRFSQSDEVYAALRLDNRVVDTTDSKPMGKDCWIQFFTLDLDRAKELEIEVSYKDPRSMCAFSVIRIGDYVDSMGTHKKTLELEPQGQLFVEVIVLSNQQY